MNKENIIVTGGYGMTGKALQRITFQYPQYNIIFLKRSDCDLTDREQTYNLFLEHNPVIVIHLAAVIGGLYFNLENNPILLDLNTRINLNVVDACIKMNVRKVILVSSTCAFPAIPPCYPMTEDDLYCGEVHKSNEGYGESKRLLDRLARMYNQIQTTTKFVTVFPCNLYGPGDNFTESKSHVIGGLMRKCYHSQESIPLWGTGNALRQFLYVDDLALLLMKVVENFDEQRMILCADEEISVGELAKTIARIVGCEGNLVYDLTKTDGLLRKTVSNKLLRSYFPDFTFTKLEEGLRKTYEWAVTFDVLK